MFSIQISIFGLHLNHKTENRGALIHLMVPTLYALSLLISTVVVYEKNLSEILEGVVPPFLQSMVWVSVTMSFVVFMRCLYMRFAALNCLLRFRHFFLFKYFQHTMNNILICSFFCISFDGQRNHFLSYKLWRVSDKLTRKKSKIEMIKFISRQHASLTDIMDLMNVCYSFQVLVSHFIVFRSFHSF